MKRVGRGVRFKKQLVSYVCMLDIIHLQRKGVFKNGPFIRWTTSWKRGGKIESAIAYHLVDDPESNRLIGLRFLYSVVHNYDGTKTDLNFVVAIESTPCNYGGERWWFICPLKVDYRTCIRRCRILYLSRVSDYLGCRECCDLTYECRQKHRDRFYEGWGKYSLMIEEANEIIRKSRSFKKKWKALCQIQKATSAMTNCTFDIPGTYTKIRGKI